MRKEVEIVNKLGLHARPAALFVRYAIRFKSKITIRKGEDSFSAASLLEVLTANLNCGDRVVLDPARRVPRARVPLVTLAMMGIAKGAAMWVSATAAVPILDKTYYSIFGSGNLGSCAGLLIWALIAAAIGHVALRKTTFGRKVLATGGSETAARFTGIKMHNIKMQVLIISSLSAAFAGMLYAGCLRSGRFQLGEGYELSVIAAAVLGGTSLFGGFGSVVGSIMGALMIGLINNGLILMGLEFSQQLITRGVIIILAVTVARSRK
jgi:ribose transport system permease protein